MSKDKVIFLILLLIDVVAYFAFVAIVELRPITGILMLVSMFLTGMMIDNLVENRHEKS